MHDCRTFTDRLVDLLFNELKADEKSRLLAEMEDCASCLGEYRSMTGALIIFDQASAATAPDESFWPVHHAALRQRLELPAHHGASQNGGSFWKRLLQMKLPVPAPAAAAIAIALLVSSVLALRPSKREVIPVLQPPVVTTIQAKSIEVPVVREKVVTRVVYVEKKVGEKGLKRPSVSPTERDETPLTARYDEQESGQGGFFTRGDLTDFQPPDEMRIRIIKRSNMR